MKIGVISDTHIPRAAPDLPQALCEALKEVDLIIHAGDLLELWVLEKLNRIAKTIAVYGNMDSHEVVNVLPEKKTIEVGNFKIGLIHGSGPPANLEKRACARFKGVDVVVFGHSHTAYMEKRGETLLFNPGSPTDKVFAPYNSYGILEIGEKIEGTIIRLENNR